MYAKLNSGAVEKYPFTHDDLQAQHPGASVPSTWLPEFMASEGIVSVVATGQPQHNSITQTLVELSPVFSEARNRWEQQWSVVDLSVEEAAANQARADAELESSVVEQTQQRLDDFARTRNYDGILSACTYSDSLVQRFRTEGQYCLAARDQTWAKLYEVMSEVEAGTRPMPGGYADIEPLLPALVWPND